MRASSASFAAPTKSISTRGIGTDDLPDAYVDRCRPRSSLQTTDWTRPPALAILVIFVTAWVARNPIEARERLANAHQRVVSATAAVSIQVEGSWRVYMRRTLARLIPGRVPTPIIMEPTGNESTGPPLRLRRGDSPVEMVSFGTEHLTSATGASFQPTQHERRASSLLRSRTPCSSPRLRAGNGTAEFQTVGTLPAVAAHLSPAPPPTPPSPPEMTPARLAVTNTLHVQGSAPSSIAQAPVTALEPAENARESELPSFPRTPQHPLLSEEEPSVRVNDTQPEPLAAPLALLDA